MCSFYWKYLINWRSHVTLKSENFSPYKLDQLQAEVYNLISACMWITSNRRKVSRSNKFRPRVSFSFIYPSRNIKNNNESVSWSEETAHCEKLRIENRRWGRIIFIVSLQWSGVNLFSRGNSGVYLNYISNSKSKP